MATHTLLDAAKGLRHNWGWFLALGAVLMLLGMFAISAAWVATLATMLVFGTIMIVAGSIEAVVAFAAPRWSGFFLHLLNAVLSLVVGALAIARPGAAAAGLTLLIAAFFLIGGFFRIAAAVSLRFPNWGWEVLGGSITLLLGAMIAAEWPESALWVIGLFVGVDLIFRGWTWVMLSFAVKRLPA